MEIKDLEINQGKVDLVVEVVEKGDVRTFEKFGKSGKVCNAKIKDATGEVKLTLWNEDVDKVNVGDKIHIENGWCGEYQGEKQVSAGKFGKIEVVEAGSNADGAGGDANVSGSEPVEEKKDAEADEEVEVSEESFEG